MTSRHFAKRIISLRTVTRFRFTAINLVHAYVTGTTLLKKYKNDGVFAELEDERWSSRSRETPTRSLELADAISTLLKIIRSSSKQKSSHAILRIFETSKYLFLEKENILTPRRRNSSCKPNGYGSYIYIYVYV